MKRGRVESDGQVVNVVERDGQVLLPDGRLLPESAVSWLPPLWPRTGFGVGLNYLSHAKELAMKPPSEPLLFLKGANTWIGHRCHTPRPADVTFMHYECELAVVIGREAHRVRERDALSYVAGYTVANDYAIRDYLENYYRPNLRVKSRDRTTPLGPWLVDAADIPDPMNLGLRATVNGRETLSGTTRDMVFGVSWLIAYLASFMTLSPGDIILTGTPDGLADCRPGDEVIVEVEKVGRLVNTIVAEEVI